MDEHHEEMSAAAKMEEIFDAYFAISNSLRDDVSYVLDLRQDDNPVWRRAFIRAVVPLIEGLAYCYLRICSADPELTEAEQGKLDPDLRQSTPERVKTSLKSIFHVLDISPRPDFAGCGWSNAQRLIRARDALMHPKGPQSLEFCEQDWAEIYDGAVWLLKEFFRLPDLMMRKYGREELLK